MNVTRIRAFLSFFLSPVRHGTGTFYLLLVSPGREEGEELVAKQAQGQAVALKCVAMETRYMLAGTGL